MNLTPGQPTQRDDCQSVFIERFGAEFLIYDGRLTGEARDIASGVADLRTDFQRAQCDLGDFLQSRSDCGVAVFELSRSAASSSMSRFFESGPHGDAMPSLCILDVRLSNSPIGVQRRPTPTVGDGDDEHGQEVEDRFRLDLDRRRQFRRFRCRNGLALLFYLVEKVIQENRRAKV